jgi:hypothetical protein
VILLDFAAKLNYSFPEFITFINHPRFTVTLAVSSYSVHFKF